MRRFSTAIVALISFGLLSIALPARADALVRVGVDGIWMPLAFHSFEEDQATLDSSHEMASFGFSAHGTLGFDIFSAGLKLNYFNQSVAFEDEDQRLTELDMNLLMRIGFPQTPVALLFEGGASTNQGLDYFGYNIGAGVTVDLLGAPGMALNLGLMGQYVNLSEVSLDFGDVDEPELLSLSEGRVMVFLGFDFYI